MRRANHTLSVTLQGWIVKKIPSHGVSDDAMDKDKVFLSGWFEGDAVSQLVVRSHSYSTREVIHLSSDSLESSIVVAQVAP